MFEPKRSVLTLFVDKEAWCLSHTEQHDGINFGGFQTQFETHFVSKTVESLKSYIPIIEMMEKIEDGVKNIMFSSDTGVLYNKRFWDFLNQSLQSILSRSKAEKRIREADLKRVLLSPFFKEVVCSMPSIRGNPYQLHGSTVEYYDSTVVEQYNITETDKLPFPIDYLLSGSMCFTAVYKIPVRVSFNDSYLMLQLAQDISTVMRDKNLADRITMGLLIDDKDVCFAFSPFVSRDGDNFTALPIVLFSPKIPWRDGDALTSVFAAICCLPNFQMKRIEIDIGKWKETLGDDLLGEYSFKFEIRQDDTRNKSESEKVQDQIKALQDQIKSQHDQIKVQHDLIKSQQERIKTLEASTLARVVRRRRTLDVSSQPD